MITAQQATQKWLNSMGRASDAYKNGVMAVTESPTAKAAAASDRYISGVQRAVESGKFQNSLQRVTLQSWQQSASNKGAARLASGAAAAQDKFQQQMGKLLPFIQQGVNQLPPRGDLAANINRMVQMATYMAGYQA